jgi:hypothetical protein
MVQKEKIFYNHLFILTAARQDKAIQLMDNIIIAITITLPIFSVVIINCTCDDIRNTHNRESITLF